MILVIDNYDSFTYNLVQYVGEQGFEQKVVRNDRITISQIRNLKPSRSFFPLGPAPPQRRGSRSNSFENCTRTTRFSVYAWDIRQ